MFFTFSRARQALLATTFLAIIPTSVGAQTGPHGQWLMWSDGSTFTTFGANAEVMIAAGQITNLCDWLFPTADVYVMYSGQVSNNCQLVDVCGLPNTVIGGGGSLFYFETIGFTMPSGCLNAGTYAVVFDECQDGQFNAADDALFDPAFEVVLPPILPPIDPAIGAIKLSSAAQGAHWRGTARDYAVFAAVARFALENASPVHSLVYQMTSLFGQCLGIDPIRDTQYSIINTAKHYEGIAADPPDPDYQHLTLLDPTPYEDSRLGDPIYQATDRLAVAVSDEAAITKALLASIERYQGAANATDGEWALIHARAAQDYMVLLAEQLGRSSVALTGLKQAIVGSPVDLDAISQDAEQVRLRIEQYGFSSEETFLLEELGFSQAEIGLLATRFVEFEWLFDDPELIQELGGPLAYTDFVQAAFLAAIDQILQYNPTATAAIQSDATLVGGIVATLEGQPSVLQRVPVADAGGAYGSSEGSTFQLDASGSHDPDGLIVLYEWDLDRDGEFDEASSAQPTVSVSFDHPFTGLVGLRVTDDLGFQGVAYASVQIDEVLSPPAIVSSSPEGLSADAALDELLILSVVASDPGSSGLAYGWTVDGVPAAETGSTFDYQPTGTQEIGVHDLRVLVSTNDLIGGATVRQWVVGVSQYGLGWDELEPYCFGATGCPCGNGDADAGCQNSNGNGAILSRAHGTTSAVADDLVVTTSGLPAQQFGVIFMGAGQISVPFGDGLRCVGAGGVGTFRFPVQNSGPAGSIAQGPGIVDFSRTSFGSAGGIDAGETWHFQGWYRDPSGPCSSSFNLSNGLSVTFVP